MVVPKSVTTFGTDTFKDCSQLTLKIYRKSVSETYAKVNNINFEYIDNGELKYQLADLKDGTFGIRFILVVDEEDVINADSASVYISVPGQGNSGTITVTKAYRSVIASGKTVLAEEGKVFLLGKIYGHS